MPNNKKMDIETSLESALNKIKGMKNPTILLSEKDFEDLKTNVKFKINIIDYNITVEQSPFIKKGVYFVYDGYFNDFYKNK